MTKRTRRDVLAKSGAVIVASAIGLRFTSSAIAEESGSVTHQVEIRQFKFVPARLQVKLGDTISWTNRHVVPHTATAVDKSWDTGLIRKDMSKNLPVTAGMTVAYYCRFHPAMKAQLELIVEISG